MSESQSAVTNMASHLAHLMLIQERTKAGLKKADIVHQILQHTENRSSATRLLKDVIDEANRMLEDTIGYKIQEVPGKNVYFLVNTLDFEGVEDYLEADPDWEETRGLLCVVLSAILMANGEVQEDNLWDFLAQVNVARDDKNHLAFGDVEKLIKTTLVKYHYLEYVKDKHGPSVFRWGIRAEHEFNKMEMLNFVSSVYGEGRSARDFTEIFQALEEAEEANQTADSMNESSPTDS